VNPLLLTQTIKDMGFKYAAFRSVYELKRKTCLLRWKFPVSYRQERFISLGEWRESAHFFFQTRGTISLPKQKSEKLRQDFERIQNGEVLYFSNLWYKTNGWLTNPDSGYHYDSDIHWTLVEDLDMKAGDIKYVWEKSRFSFLYTVIRYDYHFDEDHGRWVFDRILDWIEKNPLNCGPNYKCSQEISLRMMNWIFALNFYKYSMALTEEIFQKIINSVYWQIRHVYTNINFSRICVRNNHALTETLALYVTGLLCPFFPEADLWKRRGKKWFEEEIAYQIAEDGTYLQFSMNYHRVAVQLLTWAIVLADKNDDRFSDIVYERAYQSVNFLFQCQDDSSGSLPNYGANDGALFFPLNDKDYRDYRPQLDALHYLLTGQCLYQDEYEDRYWYCGDREITRRFQPLKKRFGVVVFEPGGYYLIREKDALTFIRCGKYRDRPGHADNLHIDIWYKGENVLSDGGSYKYNVEDRIARYFSGTESHNTLMLDGYDQMLKGSRFIWYNWSQALRALLFEQADGYCFTGVVNCFTYLDKRIRHIRKITKKKNDPVWVVEDHIEYKPDGVKMRQLWHTKNATMQITSDGNDNKISVAEGWCSSYYGQMEKTTQIEVTTEEDTVKTVITAA